MRGPGPESPKNQKRKKCMIYFIFYEYEPERGGGWLPDFSFAKKITFFVSFLIFF